MEQLVQSYEDAVVCIAFEVEGHSFPYATGWVARADRIVTTASVVVELEKLTGKGIRIVVHHRGKVVPIRATRRHSRYDATQSTERGSQRFNLGSLVPETRDLSPVCFGGAEVDWKSLTLDSRLLARGLFSSLDATEPYDPLKVINTQFPVRLIGSNPLPNEVTPLYKVQFSLPTSAEGSPVFNDQGRVIGVLAPVGASLTMVPTSDLTSLLD